MVIFYHLPVKTWEGNAAKAWQKYLFYGRATPSGNRENIMIAVVKIPGTRKRHVLPV
jgi:hypothetical protein